MAGSSETKYVNDARTVVGYGDTKDLALNDLLEKLRAHENGIGGVRSDEGEYRRPILLPPAGMKFRIYWRTSTGKLRWQCSWGPGVLEFECARVLEEEN
jgi:hypothetical protein